MRKKTYSSMLYALTCAAFISSCSTSKVDAPEALLPIPAQKQVDWQKMETYAFIHFGLNTFNDREWGYGDSDPKTFNPTRLDCEQWAETLVKAGMKGVIITAKHHDGFCLWPFAETDYNISNTPYKNGKGNIIGELSAACKKYGLKFGVYISPWDRHEASYGTPDYIPYYTAQWKDLLTNYGDLFEAWFDGANGGDGWYGGAKEKRTIDRRTYYNYPRINAMIDSIQPQVIIFSDGGPGCRWMGNEKGIAAATNWSFLRGKDVYPGYPNSQELQNGHADGDQWTAAECDVSIRPGWFYHPEQDSQVKTPEQLVDIYYRSVGRNGTLLLNFPVDRDGLIHPIDSANAVKFHEIITKELSNNLVAGISPEVTNSRGGQFTPAAMTDDDYDTYWATKDGMTTADITFQFKKPQRINRLMLQEYIPLGQRVKAFSVEYRSDGKWLPIDPGEETTTIGYKRLLRFKSITAEAVRIRITDARGPLCINNIGIYDAGANADAGIMQESEKLNSLPLTLLNVDTEKAKAATDRDEKTTCFIEGNDLIIDLGEPKLISSFHYLPDQHTPAKGLVSNYTLSVGSSAQSAIQIIKSGEFSNIKNNPILQSVYFTPVKTQFIRFKADRMINDGEPMGFAEIGIK